MYTIFKLVSYNALVSHYKVTVIGYYLQNKCVGKVGVHWDL